MNRNDRLAEFNDGLLNYGHTKTKLGNGNKRIGKEFREKGTLFFEELHTREQDYQKFSTMGKALSMKVRTQYPPFFKKISKADMIVFIDEDCYEVMDVNSDKEKIFLYWYLSKAGDGHAVSKATPQKSE
ncbi:hypothetical protein I6N96_03210 [Enterococcus sp. BWM-S5]|uniref:Phage head-tail adapter protein n=1 Tax=Enterococcus larvae TaxID=2794352 RepID=A0ABS4CFE9_9ENTE|nr:hypothetical protein [Enterococcus larvae]MBP1045272.1 hypothetical protein [Enterococcus larvae]